jgi:16S rRNA (cytosine967-C5)-methyltransferase
MWRTTRQPGDSIIGKLLTNTKLSSPDRAFALELFYGVLRNLTLLDFWVERLRDGKVDVDLRDILRLGLYQLLLAKVSEHAAVYESVELASKQRRGFINAILRTAVRQRDKLQSDAETQPLFVRTSHPEFLIARWQENFGPEATEALCKWNNQPPRIYARINQLKIGREEFMQTYPNVRPLSGIDGFVEFATTFPTEALKRGHCYIQDPSTRIACELLDPQSGEKILDACAAPGGKTSLVAQLMKNDGRVIASDRQPARIKILEENLERLGVKIARCVQHDWTRDRAPAAIASIAPFDRILVDVPCTNTGVMRRRVDVRWRLRPTEFSRMQQEQLSILRTVVPLLKANGVLVYSTCSLEPEENRMLVQNLVKEMSILQLVEEKDCLPFRDGFDGAYVAKFIKRA